MKKTTLWVAWLLTLSLLFSVADTTARYVLADISTLNPTLLIPSPGGSGSSGGSEPNATYTFEYTGDAQTFVCPANGYYTFLLYGASGASGGGMGAHTKGTVYLLKDTVLYLYVGGAGSSATTPLSYSPKKNQPAKLVPGGFNGGGSSYISYLNNPSLSYNSNTLGSGGGATDIRIGGDSLAHRVMVAAGGGGGANYNYGSPPFTYPAYGGNGGTLIGVDGSVGSQVSSITGNAFYKQVYLGKGGSQGEGGGLVSFFDLKKANGNYEHPAYQTNELNFHLYSYSGPGRGGSVYGNSVAEATSTALTHNGVNYLTLNSALTLTANTVMKDIVCVVGGGGGYYGGGLGVLAGGGGGSSYLPSHFEGFSSPEGAAYTFTSPQWTPGVRTGNGECVIEYSAAHPNNATVTENPDESISYDFGYVGYAEVFVTLISGEYTFELYGASGGAGGGLGAYTKGTVYLPAGVPIYIYVGGQGSTYTSNWTDRPKGIVVNGGFNGGGHSYISPDPNTTMGSNTSLIGAGGGGTDIRVGGYTLPYRIMVAGGGGGSANFNYDAGTSHVYQTSGGSGGTLTGAPGWSFSTAYFDHVRNALQGKPYYQQLYVGQGGTQSAGGSFSRYFNDASDTPAALAAYALNDQHFFLYPYSGLGQGGSVYGNSVSQAESDLLTFGGVSYRTLNDQLRLNGQNPLYQRIFLVGGGGGYYGGGPGVLYAGGGGSSYLPAPGFSDTTDAAYTFSDAAWTPGHQSGNGRCVITVRMSGGPVLARTVAVSFDTNGGTEIPFRYVTHGTTLELPEPPTKPGYTFAGWYRNAALSIPFDPMTMITGDMTLYAHWVRTTLSPYTPGTAFWADGYRERIRGVSFAEHDDVPPDALEVWDLTSDGSDTILAWLTPAPGDGYHLTVGSDTPIIVTDLDHYFRNMTALTSVEGLDTLDTTGLRSLRATFAGCTSLVSLDLSGLETGALTSLQQTFEGCTALVRLDTTGWQTASLRSLYRTFAGCAALFYTPGLSGWQTGQVSSMAETFSGCASLTALDLSGWDTAALTTLEGTFYGCGALQSVDTTGWDLSALTTLRRTFYGCRSLLSVPGLAEWDTAGVTNMQGTFAECTSLTALPVADWQTGQVRTMHTMFYACRNLRALDLSGWDVSLVESFRMTFASCLSLEVLSATGWQLGAPDLSFLFDNCLSLTSITGYETWDLSGATDTTGMFRGCYQLVLP